jgi:hypothetical protein
MYWKRKETDLAAILRYSKFIYLKKLKQKMLWNSEHFFLIQNSFRGRIHKLNV